MVAVLHKRSGSSWARLTLATVLFALILLAFSFLFALPTSAFANEVQDIQSTRVYEGDSGEDTGSSHPDTYDFTTQDLIDAQTNQSNGQGEINIPENEVPLSNFLEINQTVGTGGSAYNALLALVCIVLMGTMLLMLLIRRTSDFRVITMRTISVAFGLVTVTTWSLLDRMQTPSVIFNTISIVMTLLFAVFVATASVSYVYEKRLNKDGASRHANDKTNKQDND